MSIKLLCGVVFLSTLMLWLGDDVQAQTQKVEIASCEITPPEIYERVGSNIVHVVSFGVDPYRVAGRDQSGSGSGILIEPGLVLTNYHVVQHGRLMVVVSDEGSFEAELIGTDPVFDIALLAIPSWGGGNKDVVFGSYNDLVVGQKAYVLGYPLSIGLTLTAGIISGLDRKLPLNTNSWTTRYIQTDAAVSPGNSGGALLDACGRVIGLVTLKSSHPDSENIGYALPIDSALPLVEEIVETGQVARPWHGLYGQMMSPLIGRLMLLDENALPEGFLIETIEPGSAADKAGLQGGIIPVTWGNAEILIGGDVITEVNGEPIRDLGQALEAVESLKIGEAVRLRVWREGNVFEVTAEINERPSLERDLWAPGK